MEKEYKAKKAKSQIKDVALHLLQYGDITSMQAWSRYHITRLSDVIFKLRKLGYIIDTNTEQGTNEYGAYRYARYELVEVPEHDFFSSKVPA